jgi:hypothetical protein
MIVEQVVIAGEDFVIEEREEEPEPFCSFS